MKTKRITHVWDRPFPSFCNTIRDLTLFLGLVFLVAPPLLVAATNCLAPPSGLAGWWSGNADATDRTGANPGTIQGGLTFETGEVGQAFSLHAGADAVMIPASASLDVGAGVGFTIETWINPRDITRRNPLVEWNRGGTTATEWGVQLWLAQPGDFGLSAGSFFANLAEANGTPHFVTSQGGVVQTGLWQHVALTFDKTSTEARLFYNGTLVTNMFLGAFQPATSYDLFLGRRPAGDGTSSYDGLLDEVAIYNRALAPSEIQAIYGAGAAGKCPPNPGQNLPPTISALPNQTITAGTSTGPLAFTVTDAETAPSNLVVTASSSNLVLAPNSSIALGGSGSNRTVNITPVSGQSGTATITLSVSDGQATRSTSFTLAVQPAGGPGPAIAPIPNQTMLVDEPTPAIELALTDADTPLAALHLTGTSSNPALVPNQNIFFGLAGGRWFVTVTPLFGQIGSANITVGVSDGTTTASTAFKFTAQAPPPGTARFAASSGLTIPASGPAAPYPARLEVAGMNGTITHLELSLDRFTHANVRDVNMLLVAPNGLGAVLFSHVSGDRSAANVRVNLTDDAGFFLPDNFDLWSEPLKPAAFPPPVSFPAPAPAGPYGPVALSTFNGLAANGTWSLYVFDDASGNSGSIAGGWSLLITSSGGSSAPSISDIPDQTTTVNTPTRAIPFTVADPDTPLNNLTLDKHSSNPLLVPAANIVFGGTGGNRTVTVTPAPNQSGTATITVTVSDGARTASDSFVLNVVSVGGHILTVTADDAARLYGVANPKFTGRLDGLQDGDKITFSFITAATASSAVGVYPIVPLLNDSGGKLAKYTVVTNLGTLTISPAPLDVRADSKTRVYGGANPPLTGKIVGLRNGDNITAGFVAAANLGSAAGIYSIKPVLTDPDGKLNNYSLVMHSGTLVVNQAPLSVIADDKARLVAVPNPPLTGTITGIQNGDKVTAEFTTAAGPLSLPGSYPITPELVDPDHKLGNYKVSSQDGTLTVSLLVIGLGDALPRLEVTAQDKTRVYGASDPAFTGTLNGVQAGDNITVSFVTGTTPASPAGIYTINPVLHDPNGKLNKYKVIVHRGTFAISPVALDVKADDKSRRVGAANPALTGTLTGLRQEDKITATFSTTATVSSPAGSYPIIPVLSDPNNRLGNYIMAVDNGVLTVTRGGSVTLVLAVRADGRVHVSGTGEPNAQCVLQASSDLIHWETIGSISIGGDGHFGFDEDGGRTIPRRFFRGLLQ